MINPATYIDFRDKIQYKVAQLLQMDGYKTSSAAIRSIVQEDIDKLFSSWLADEKFGIVSTDEHLMQPAKKGFLGRIIEDARLRILADIYFDNEYLAATPDQWVVMMYGEDTMGIVHDAVTRAYQSIDPLNIKPPVFRLANHKPRYEDFGHLGQLKRSKDR